MQLIDNYLNLQCVNLSCLWYDNCFIISVIVIWFALNAENKIFSNKQTNKQTDGDMPVDNKMT